LRIKRRYLQFVELDDKLPASTCILKIELPAQSPPQGEEMTITSDLETREERAIDDMLAEKQEETLHLEFKTLSN